MTKDQEVSRWYAEQLSSKIPMCELPISACFLNSKFDINDPACQMEIIDWHCGLNDLNTLCFYHDEVTFEKNRGDYISEHNGTTLKEALIALWEVLKDE